MGRAGLSTAGAADAAQSLTQTRGCVVHSAPQYCRYWRQDCFLCVTPSAIRVNISDLPRREIFHVDTPDCSAYKYVGAATGLAQGD